MIKFDSNNITLEFNIILRYSTKIPRIHPFEIQTGISISLNFPTISSVLFPIPQSETLEYQTP